MSSMCRNRIFILIIAVYAHHAQGALYIEPVDPPNGVEYPTVAEGARGPAIAFSEGLSKSATNPLVLGTLKSDNGGALTNLGNAGMPISFDPASGVLTLTAEMDHETYCVDPANTKLSCYGTLEILEAGTATLFYVYLLDSNDNIPQFNDPVCLPQIDENADYAEICTFTAVDKDRWVDNGKLKFSLTDSTGLFQINEDTGVLGLTNGKQADYEGVSAPRLYVKVKDSADQSPADYPQVITVKDKPDRPPVFEGLSGSYSVDETQGKDTPILIVTASDGDREVDDTITYDFIVTDGLSSSGEPYFALNPDTGEITVNIDNMNTTEIMDHRGSLTFYVELIAKEVTPPDNEEANAYISIVVVDKDSSNPHFDGDQTTVEFTVSANETQTGVIHSFVIYDQDTDTDLNGYTAELVPPAGADVSWFRDVIEVTPSEGNRMTTFNVQVKAGMSIDYDKIVGWRTPVEFSVKVVSKTTGNPAEALAKITLTVNGMNDNVPKFSSDYDVLVDENSEMDKVIATVHATDDDFETDFGQSSLVYGWDPDRTIPDNLFIDPTSGEIKISTETAFDFEAKNEYKYYVRVWDNSNGPGANSVTAKLRIIVNDINDEQPKLTITETRFDIMERRAPGPITETVIKVTDADADHELEYSLGNPVAYSKHGQRLEISNLDWFKIEMDPDGTTGNLILVAEPDREKVERVELVVTATDNKTSTDPKYEEMRSIHESIFINILNVNDEQPLFEPIDPDIAVQETDPTYLEDTEARRRIADFVVLDKDPAPTDFYFILTSDHEFAAEMLALVELDNVPPVNNGRVTLRRKNGVPIDRETFLTLHYILTVYDDDPAGSSPPRSDAIRLDIRVLDFNDNPPVWAEDYSVHNYLTEETSNSRSNSSQIRRENGPSEDISIPVCEPGLPEDGKNCLKATDIDDPDRPSGTITYLFKGTDQAIGQAFTIDGKTGCICAKETDRENKADYTITVQAADSFGFADSKITEVTIQVRVTDVNDNSPLFTLPGGGDNIIIDESFEPLALVGGGIVVSDRDELDNAKMDIVITGITCTRPGDVCPEPYTDSFDLTVTDGVDVGEKNVQIIVKEGFNLIFGYGTYCIDIEASNPDGVPQLPTKTEKYCIQVDDVNNKRPTFVQGPEYEGIKFYVDEVTEPGQPLVNFVGGGSLIFTGTDEDQPNNPNSDVSCRVKSDHAIADNYFRLDNADGILRLKNKWLAAHNNKIVPLCMEVVDKGTPPLESAQNVCLEMILKPLSTHAPEFAPNEVVFDVKENDVNQQVGLFDEATDEDIIGLPEDDNIYYHIAGYGDAPIDNFYIPDMAVNSLSLKEPLDRETEAQYLVYVLASNYPEPPLIEQNPVTNSSYLKIILNVLDHNDQPPKFETPTGEGGIFATILESVTGNTAVGDKIVVTDADIGENAQIVFQITKITCSTEENDPCAIPNPDAFDVIVDPARDNENNLQIITKEGFNFASALGLYCIEIEASNPDGDMQVPPTVEVYCVLVVNLNNEIPYFEAIPSHIEVEETDSTSVNQTDVERNIMSVTAMDNDPNTLFCFKLTSDLEDGAAMLDVVELFPAGCVLDGKVTLRRINGKYIDHEMFKNLVFNLTVFDEDPEVTEKFHTSTLLLTIKVIDLNDNIPIWSEDYASKEYFVTEGGQDVRVMSKKIGHKNGIPTVLLAYDDDGPASAYGRVTYLLQGTIQGTFAIDPFSGRLTADVSKIDREVTAQYELLVEASDNYWPGIPENSNTIQTTLHVTVLDANDNSPKFLTTPNYTAPGVFVKIPRDTPAHTEVGVPILAQDLDEGFNAALDIALIQTVCTEVPRGLRECSGIGMFQLIDQDLIEGMKSIQIKTVKPFESENTSEKYCLLIEVKDLGNPQQMTQTEYCVLVEN